jgi:DNA ligase-1
VSITKPLLAVNAEDITKLKFPVLCTVKLDGIRCLVVNGQCLSRSFKPIPNEYVRTTIEQDLGSFILDGELMLDGSQPFNEVSSAIMDRKDKPNFKYYIFDLIGKKGLSEPYSQRMKNLEELNVPSYVVKVLPKIIESSGQLAEAQQLAMGQGYEGLMVRSPESNYKCGRSTLKEGILLKIKVFEDAEAVIIGFEELMSNQNEATKDAFGRTERSSHKENMVATGTLGSLVVKDLVSGVVFKIGVGFDAHMRVDMWIHQERLLGQLVTYKKQPSGEHEKPRFPVFKSLRHPDDIS